MKIGNYSLVFRPRPQTYPGLSGNELVHGQFYDEWVVNDHCHICDDQGNWHLFGITHPLTAAANIHEGELQLFHAVAPSPLGPYRDLGTILPPSERPSELPEIHSPYIVRRDGFYLMIYGPEHFRMARSTDLYHWETLGTVIPEVKKDARDPQILYHDGRYILSYCMGNQVYCRFSEDMFHWSERRLLLTLADGLSPESPFLYYNDGRFYLFVCLWDGVWDQRSVEQAYQSQTCVYSAPELKEFTRDDCNGTVRAHAPEIIEYRNKTYISSAFYPENGIQIAELSWN